MKLHRLPLSEPGEDEDLLHGTTRFVWVRQAPAIRQGLALFTLLFGLIPTVGYLFDIRVLYQSIPGGADTSKLTLICMILIATVILIQRPITRAGWIEKFLLLVTGALALGSLGEHVIWPEHVEHVTMGQNTAICVLALVSALLIRRRSHAWPALLLGGAAWMICFSAFLGYAMGLGQLHGALSPVTLVMMTPLVLASQIGQARRVPLRALFRDDRLSRMLRLEMALAVVVPTTLGILLFRLAPGGPSAADAIYIQLILVFCCVGVLV
ncbi:MAG: hypothetical protein ACP5EN_16580, partial [Rhodovulum sp.]